MNFNAIEIGEFYAFCTYRQRGLSRVPPHAHKVKVIAKKQIRIYPNKKVSTRVAVEFDNGSIRQNIPGNQIISPWDEYKGDRDYQDDELVKHRKKRQRHNMLNHYVRQQITNGLGSDLVKKARVTLMEDESLVIEVSKEAMFEALGLTEDVIIVALKDK